MSVDAGMLELRVGATRRVLTPGSPVTIGRDPGAVVRVDDAHVSRLHAVLSATASGWVLVDHSRNGMFRAGTRVARVEVTAPTTVTLGRRDGVVLTLRPAAGAPPPPNGAGPIPGGAPSTTHRISAQSITRIGRLPDNDVVLDDLLVSRRHAELRPVAGGHRLIDLNSPNGTFVNGHRITEAALSGGDLVGIGHALLEYASGRLVEYLDTGEITFEARAITVLAPDGRRLLDDVSFALPAGCMLAVIGPSGAGKSTLLRALTGQRPADLGRVRYDGRDLYANYDELRQRIGLVPQDDILHPQLTVERALAYAARLRFPGESTPAERARRIAEVLAELDLTTQAAQRISSLSGGQRKRVSVALELLTKPSLLFLDEPTSGLDPGLDKAVMEQLRDLARGGRTVAVVTHSVANLDVCDRVLVLARGGRIAYFGPPGDALSYFGLPGFAEVFQELNRDPGTVWADRFAGSQAFHRNVGATLNLPAAAPPPSVPLLGPRQQPRSTQFAVLCRRYLAVIAADRAYLISLAMLPAVLSLLARAVPGSDGLSVAAGTTQPRQLMLILVLGAALMGSAAAVRELVKERAIYQRERAAGLSLTAYLGSKIAVLAGITALQAVVLTVLALLGQPGADDPLVFTSGTGDVIAAVTAVAVIAMVIGLLISALIANADRAMPPLVVIVMAQLILCGGLFPVRGRAVLEQLSWLAPSRWGYAMGAATLELGKIPPPSDDPLWNHSVATWSGDLLALATLGVVLVAGAVAALLRSDPGRRG
ncbi:MAG: ATP-binding cassette domain-containing protein [Pseudonocardia sp.]|nr:ATP-binding cassette domain-containing protein [Pseudonocardia sp.]